MIDDISSQLRELAMGHDPGTSATDTYSCVGQSLASIQQVSISLARGSICGNSK